MLVILCKGEGRMWWKGDVEGKDVGAQVMGRRW